MSFRVSSPRRWLVTGAAGFIGSHLVQHLLSLGEEVRGIDNFVTGKKENLEDVRRNVREEDWKRFDFVEADILDAKAVHYIIQGCDVVLHQAALGSVPRSVDNPLRSNETNVAGFLSVLTAAHAANVKNFVYASSSSVYGDLTDSPKKEDRLGKPLSPYAVTKLANELYAQSFHSLYKFPIVGLRYFNVFGPRQDPEGEYAAVIPRWIGALVQGRECVVFGDGETSRDFCFVRNVVEANLLASQAPPEAWGKSYNVACGKSTSLNELYQLICQGLRDANAVKDCPLKPIYKDFRPGDVRHSLADISRAGSDLGYQPLIQMKEGVEATTRWFAERATAARSVAKTKSARMPHGIQA